MVSALDKAKRALIVLLRALAAAYGLALSVTRESSDKEVSSAYRKVSRCVHPDKNRGNTEDQKKLNVAYNSWEEVGRKTPNQGGARAKNSESSGTTLNTAMATQTRAEYRINSLAVLLTYQGFGGTEQWARFVVFVEAQLKPWRVKYWSATLENNAEEGCHAHLMLQFASVRDCTVRSFSFEGLRPNAQATDLLGDGFCRKRLQGSIDRGMFYVWANKIGTVLLPTAPRGLCVAGNYEPAWTSAKCRYQVLGQWPEKLWKQYKLDGDMYEEYLHLSRDGLPARKRNLEVYQAWSQQRALEKEVADRTKRIRSNPALYQPFGRVPQAEQWLELFTQDALRYPVLLVHAPSFTGKTEWAESLFKNPLKLQVGTLTHFPEGARKLDRGKHDGLVLDDLRDLQFLSEHQDKLQGKYSGVVEMATTPSGQYAYEKDFYRLPVVVTVNNDTKNLHLLGEGCHDFLSKRANVWVLSFTGRPGTAPPSDSLPER